jgi:hypothetical protein
MMGGNAEVHPRLMASPLGYLTAKSVATAWDVATRSAVVLFPEAQYPTSALAASSAVGCGAGGTTGAAVVGTGTVVVVVVDAGGIVAIVVDPTTVVVGSVVGEAALEVPQAATAIPRTTASAAVRTHPMREDVTVPF